MELVTPGLGLIFWMTLSFGIVLYILRKFAWGPILSTIKERESHIANSLRNAKRIQRELGQLDETREKLLIQAREDASELVKQAKSEGESIIRKAQEQARKEASEIIETAQSLIQSERNAAAKQMKDQIVLLSLEMAQNVLQKEFSDVDKKSEYLNRLMDEISLN